MRVLKLTVWAMTWAALGYLWRERIADREQLRTGQPAAASLPPFLLPPPSEVIDLPALTLPRQEVPENIDATEEMATVHVPANIDATDETATISAPRAAPVPLATHVVAANPQRMALSRTTGLVLAVIVTGAALGAAAVWMLSAIPSLR